MNGLLERAWTGERRGVRVAEVQAGVEKAGLEWQAEPTLRGITVSRYGRQVSRQDIVASLTDALGDQVQGGPFEINFGGAQPALFVGRDAPASVRVEALDYDARSRMCKVKPVLQRSNEA